MKIAITGHSTGLGAELKTAYEEDGHEVTGFSRRTGYDLRDWSRMQAMLDKIQDYDMFISSAKPDFVQTATLYQLWERWRGQDKCIINISSILTYYPTCPDDIFLDPYMDLYRTAKVSLNDASAQLTFKSKLPHIVLVKPVHLYSNPITADEQQKLTLWVNTFKDIMKLTQQNKFNLLEVSF